MDMIDIGSVADDGTGDPLRTAFGKVNDNFAGLGPRLAGGAYNSPGVWDQSIDGSAANIDFTGLAGAKKIRLIANLVTKASSGLLAVRVSVNNGSSFFATSGDYVWLAPAGTRTASTAMAVFHTTNATAARSGIVDIEAANVNGAPKVGFNVTYDSEHRLFVASMSPINAVRVYNTAGGNQTGGQVYCEAWF